MLENYYATAIPMGIVVADENGKVMFAKKPTPENRYDNPEINRNDLRTLLLDSLASNTVFWDRMVTGLEEHNGQWLLHFEGKPDVTTDFIIGANGGMSKVRNHVTDTQAHETGTFIIQGDVPHPAINCPEFYGLCNGNRLMASYQGNLLVANPYNNGVLTYGMIFEKPEQWGHDSGLNFRDTDKVIAFLSGRLSRWDERYRQLIRSTTVFVGLPTKNCL